MIAERRLSLDHLTVIDVSPVAAIELAATSGVAHISIIPGIPGLPELGVPDIVPDRVLHRETALASETTGVKVHTLEGFMLTPDVRLADFDPLFELAATVGAGSGVVIIYDDEGARAADNFGKLCEVAAKQNMRLNIEYVPVTCAPSFASALNIIDRAGSPKNAGLVIDILHHIRSGATIDDITRIDPARIGAAQICDGMLAVSEKYYHDVEMLFERLLPGEGEFPLREFIASLPNEAVIGVETPMASRRAAGESAQARAISAIGAAISVFD